MTNPRSLCLGCFYLCASVKSKIFRKHYALVSPEPPPDSSIKLNKKNELLKHIELCPEQCGKEAY